jgi:hypothetical protein
MECMVTACVEGEPVRWRIRQQQEEFCYLVQNGTRLDPTMMVSTAPNGTDLDRGVEKVHPASAQ